MLFICCDYSSRISTCPTNVTVVTRRDISPAIVPIHRRLPASNANNAVISPETARKDVAVAVAAMAFVTLACSLATLRVNVPRQRAPADPAAEAFATIATTRGISPVNAPWGRKGEALEAEAWVEVAESLSATNAKDLVTSLASVPAAAETFAIDADKLATSPATVLNRILESGARPAPPSSAIGAAKPATWPGTVTTQSKRLRFLKYDRIR